MNNPENFTHENTENTLFNLITSHAKYYKCTPGTFFC